MGSLSLRALGKYPLFFPPPPLSWWACTQLPAFYKHSVHSCLFINDLSIILQAYYVIRMGFGEKTTSQYGKRSPLGLCLSLASLMPRPHLYLQ